jgi:hypothetical protein
VTPSSRRRGAFQSLVVGLRAAAARPALVALLWSCHLVLGFALAIPMFRWLYEATAYRPAADAMASRFSFGGLAELLQFDSVSVPGILQAGVAGGALVAILISPLLIAATLASLRDGSLRRAEPGSGAAALYWPFLRAIVFGRALALGAGGITATVLRLALKPLRDSSWEPGFLWAAAIQVAGAGLVVVLLLAAVDYALVRLEAGQSRGALRAWWAGAGFALSRPMLTLGVWAGAGVVLALALTVFVALREITTSAGAALPAAAAVATAFVLQQAFMLSRTWLRVGLLGAEQHASAYVREPSLAVDPDVATNTTPLLTETGPLRDSTEPSAVGER